MGTDLSNADMFQAQLLGATLTELFSTVPVSSGLLFSNARVIADELRSFAPDFATPVVPVFQPSDDEPMPYASLYTLHRKYHWFFEPVVYHSTEHLIEIMFKEVIEPAEAKRLELRDAR